MGFTHRTSRVCTSPNVDGILPESWFPSNNLSFNQKHLYGEKQEYIYIYIYIYINRWVVSAAYTCISTISELKSLAGMGPESWFLLKWLQVCRNQAIVCAKINVLNILKKKTSQVFNLQKEVQAWGSGGWYWEGSCQLIICQVQPVEFGEIPQRWRYFSSEVVRIESPGRECSAE